MPSSKRLNKDYTDLNKFYTEQSSNVFHFGNQRISGSDVMKTYHKASDVVGNDISFLSGPGYHLAKSVFCEPMNTVEHYRLLNKPKDELTKEDIPVYKELTKQKEECYLINSGMRKNNYSQKQENNTSQYAKVMETIVATACKNKEFNLGHSQMCCGNPGVTLGWTTDHDDVARVCDLPRV